MLKFATIQAWYNQFIIKSGGGGGGERYKFYTIDTAFNYCVHILFTNNMNYTECNELYTVHQYIVQNLQMILNIISNDLSLKKLHSLPCI